jgi:hypothetical protein
MLLLLPLELCMTCNVLVLQAEDQTAAVIASTFCLLLAHIQPCIHVLQSKQGGVHPFNG